MLLRDALAARIERVRCPEWAHENAYIRFHYRDSGHHGMWADLYERTTQEAIGTPTPQKVAVYLLDMSAEVVAYAGPLDLTDTTKEV